MSLPSFVIPNSREHSIINFLIGESHNATSLTVWPNYTPKSFVKRSGILGLKDLKNIPGYTKCKEKIGNLKFKTI